MGGIAFLFGGPGLAEPGMGKDLYNKLPLVRESLDKADKVLNALGGTRPTKACFAGDAALMGKPSVAAPAVLALAHGVFRTLKSRHILPQCSAGLGWGEWVALGAQGALDYEAALKLLYEYGLRCEEAWTQKSWHAFAEQGLPVDKVEERIAAVSVPVRRLALLGPEQAVFGGDKAILELMRGRMSQFGRTVQISPVEPGWQWPHEAFTGAVGRFAEDLGALELEPLSAPLMGEAEGEEARQPREWLPGLKARALRVPDWPALGRSLRRRGVDTVVEVGHGSALGAALRASDPGLRALSTEDAAALAQALKLSH